MDGQVCGCVWMWGVCVGVRWVGQGVWPKLLNLTAPSVMGP